MSKVVFVLRCSKCKREIPAGSCPEGEHHVCGGVWQKRLSERKDDAKTDSREL